MKRLKGIIFDMDGTLADTEEIHRQAFNEAFSEFKLNAQWNPAEYRTLLAISGGRERIQIYLTEHHAAAMQPQDIATLSLALHRRKSEIYRDKLVAGHIGLRPGVARVISEAGATGIKLGIATSSSRKNVETLLQNALGKDALSRFDAIVTCDSVEEKKPSPAVYQFALAQLGLEPENCVAIEDTHNGNIAALQAGLTTIITTHAFTLDDDFAGAALVVDQLGEPGQPFQILSGNAFGHDYINVSLLEAIVSSAAETARQNRLKQKLVTAN